MEKLEYPAIGETLYRETLANGLRLNVAVKPSYTRSFAFFATEYGGADRRFRLGGESFDTPMGVAHYLEHKMFDMPEGDNALGLLASNGAQPNAYTASGVTAYHFDSTENFYDNLRMLLRFVSTPWFTDETVEKERGIIAQEIRMGEDDPDHAVYDELMRCLYASHPIRDPVIGTVESIRAITPQVLHGCYRAFYRPDNMALSVVGDVDPETVAEIARSTLPARQAGPLPARDYGEEESPLPFRPRHYRKMEVSAPQFMLGVKLPGGGRGLPLLRQKLLSDVAVTCLYGTSSPFYNRLYEQGLVSTDFFADLDYAAGTMTFLSGGESRDPEAVFSAVVEEARRAALEGIEPGYFSRTMKAGYGLRLRALSSFGGLAASLADGGFGEYNCLDAFELLPGISAEEVREFIAAHFVPERFAMSVVVPDAGGTGDA